MEPIFDHGIKVPQIQGSYKKAHVQLHMTANTKKTGYTILQTIQFPFKNCDTFTIVVIY